MCSREDVAWSELIAFKILRCDNKVKVAEKLFQQRFMKEMQHIGVWRLEADFRL